MPQLIQNIYQSLQKTAELTPDAVVLVFENKSWTYKQFIIQVNQTMSWLSGIAKLNKGDKVVLAWGNTPAFCTLFYASVGLGIQVMPLSTKLKEFEGKALLENANADAVFWDDNSQSWLGEYKNRGLSLSEWQSIKLPAESKFINRVNLDDTAVIMFTSGTTGTPKGAVISHGNILAAVNAYQSTLNLTANEKTILAVPIYHITGLSAILALFIHIGGTIYLHRKFNSQEVISSLAKNQITFLHGSPTVFILLIKTIKENKIININNFKSLSAIACGAGHLNEGTIESLTEIFPTAVIHSIYGLTETSSPATIFRGDLRHSSKKSSSGQPIPSLSISIRDEQLNQLPIGETGNIWLKGDVVIKSYWPSNSSNRKYFNNEWFFTGDIGYVDQDGYLFIQDRIKDMINRGGEKIYSIEIENLLSTYPGISEVAVIPINSSIYGEEPVAFIVPENQACLISKEIMEWLKERISKYKIPVKIIFIRTLPRTWNGKICKRELKDKYSEITN